MAPNYTIPCGLPFPGSLPIIPQNLGSFLTGFRPHTKSVCSFRFSRSKFFLNVGHGLWNSENDGIIETGGSAVNRRWLYRI